MGCRLKATMTIMLVNDAVVLLSLHEVAAGGQPLKKAGGGRGGRAQRLPPQCVPYVARRCLCVCLPLLMLIDTMLSLKNRCL